MQTLLDLVKSLLNATLILVALCLFLGWKLMQTVSTTTAHVKDTVEVVRPITSQLASLREEVKALQTQLQARDGTEVGIELAQMSARLESIEQQISNLNDLPDRLSETVATATLAGLQKAMTRLRTEARAGSDSQ